MRLNARNAKLLHHAAFLIQDKISGLRLSLLQACSKQADGSIIGASATLWGLQK